MDILLSTIPISTISTNWLLLRKEQQFQIYYWMAIIFRSRWETEWKAMKKNKQNTNNNLGNQYASFIQEPLSSFQYLFETIRNIMLVNDNSHEFGANIKWY